MASREKRLEKLTSSEYALLRELTFGAPLDGASLEAAIGNIVKDRLKMAQGLLKGVAGTPGTELKELRLRRNEFDYSPYPGAKPGTPYPSKQRTSIIRNSVRRADKLIRALDKFLKERK